APDAGYAGGYRQFGERGRTEDYSAAEPHAGPFLLRPVRPDDSLVQRPVCTYMDDVPGFRKKLPGDVVRLRIAGDQRRHLVNVFQALGDGFRLLLRAFELPEVRHRRGSRIADDERLGPLAGRNDV